MIKFFKTDEKLHMTQIQSFDQNCWVDMVNPTDDEVEVIMSWTGFPEEMLKAANAQYHLIGDGEKVGNLKDAITRAYEVVKNI